MFGEVGSDRSARLPRAEPKRVYSTHLSSRIHSNSLKTNDGRHGYPSQNREDNLPGFGPLRDKNSISLFPRHLLGVN